ncbi:MAG: Gfo/Idh/MocA family oxidoreductase [Candidatus Omnitrophica bacterium]|nr:Gfo/Idh/MocA family oxidoreductase [Candidatus Omnitrophota bacterium]
MFNIGVIGYGYWGPFLARNFNNHTQCRLTAISDKKEDRLEKAKQQYPHVRISKDLAPIYAEDVDAVAIATPTSTHYELAKEALLHNKHIWIEKPMTSTSAEAQKLIDLAEKQGKLLLVDHTFLFTSAVQKLKELIKDGVLGDLFYYDSVRVNLGLFQHDVNVVWDLAPHDLSIVDYLIDEKPKAISACAMDHFHTGREDIAYLTLYYDNNLISHFHLNWMSPVKIRRTIIGGSQKMIVWDDINPAEKIRIYDKGATIESRRGEYGLRANYRMGDVVSPAILEREALFSEVDHFVDCIQKNTSPINDGASGLRIIQLLEATDESIRLNGKVIEL